jgi:hypothetical protein
VQRHRRARGRPDRAALRHHEFRPGFRPGPRY